MKTFEISLSVAVLLTLLFFAGRLFCKMSYEYHLAQSAKKGKKGALKETQGDDDASPFSTSEIDDFEGVASLSLDIDRCAISHQD